MGTSMPVLQLVRGLPFPTSSRFTKKNIEETLDYVPHDGDIIIGSFPKTGTTWLQYIVLQIVSKGEVYPSMHDATHKFVPYMEMTGAAAVDALEDYRIYKHHVPYYMVRKNDKAKYLYIYRNPEDTLVSYFHFMQNIQRGPVDFCECFEDFLAGNVSYGSYYDHVFSFLDHKEDENLLLISYEKLSVNTREEILNIAKFLGDEYFRELSNDESLLEQIMERTSFDYMKKNLRFTHPGPDKKADSSENQPHKFDFFRKGTVGDGKVSLSPEQLKRVRDKTVEEMKGTQLLQEWIKE